MPLTCLVGARCAHAAQLVFVVQHDRILYPIHCLYDFGERLLPGDFQSLACLLARFPRAALAECIFKNRVEVRRQGVAIGHRRQVRRLLP